MRRILVIRLSALGDVAILAPVMRARAMANPDVEFVVAASPMLEPLFRGMANVRFLGLKKQQSSWKIFKALNKVDADAVADVHKVNRVGRALLLLRLKNLFRKGFTIESIDKGRRSRRRFLHHKDMTPRRPQWQRYNDVFNCLGLSTPSDIHTFKGQEGECIGVAPFAQHEGKIWPLELTTLLVHMLDREGYKVMLFGGKNEVPHLQKMAEECERVEVVAGKYTFEEELELIKRLSLMVSMDSSNMHFASAVGTKVVSIWGATHPDFGFYGFGQDRKNALCANLPCQPCSAFGQKKCKFGDYRCLRQINPEMVLAKIKENL